MAQKQYTMDFVLNAVLNGGFSSTFSKAQQEFVRLGTEIKNLQAIQRDVTAYQKQAQAVQNTENKLENLKRQYELINKQIAETTGSTTALEREKLKLEQRISSTEAALEKQKQRLEETKGKLDEAGISTDNLAGKDAELQKKIDELTEEQKKCTEGAQDYGTTASEALDAVAGAIAAAGIAKALKEVADAWKECVTVAADFEQSMSAVEAIADATDEEMDALTAQAKELGATTIYTAQQSADAMEYMAMAGWDAQEMLAGMPAMTTLAAAAGEDLAQVSDIVTDNLTAFGLTASDTAHFADVLAAAAANSNTNISIMGETFKSSSAVAGALGYSIEDVAVMTGLMANAAVKGSRAGTALRNIFNGLVGGMTLTADAFGEVEYSAVNTDGSMKGLVETVRDLRYYFDQMTEAEKIMNAKDIAGMRGYNGLLAILNATDEDFQSLYDSINDCEGAAERMASVKLDNLNGDITLMQSALEALKSTIGEEFNPELRTLTQLGTEGINWMNVFIQENPALSKGLTVAAGSALALASGITAVSAAAKILTTTGLFSGWAGIALVAGAGVAALAGLAEAAYTEATEFQNRVDDVTGSAREMNDTLEETQTAYEETVRSTEAAAVVAERYVDRLNELEEEQGESARNTREYQDTLALLLQTMPELSDEISVTTDEYGRSTYALNADTDAILKHIDALKQQAMAQAFQDQMNDIYKNYAEVLLEVEQNRIKLTEAQDRQKTATDNYNKTLAELNALEKQAREEYEGFDTVVYPERYEELQNALAGYREEMEQANDDVAVYAQAVSDGEAATIAADAALAEAEQAWKNAAEAAGIYTEESGYTTESMDELATALENPLASLKLLEEAYDEVYAAVKESMEGQVSLFDTAAEVVPSDLSAIGQSLKSWSSYYENYDANLQTILEHVDELEGVGEIIASLGEGTEEGVNFAAALANAINSGDIDRAQQLVKQYDDAISKADAASDTYAQLALEMPNAMQDIDDAVQEGVEGMSLPEEAEDAARATINAYIAQADNMMPAVREAYRQMGLAAINALGLNYYTDMYSTGTKTTGTATGSAAAQERLETTPTVSSILKMIPNLGSYASGTDSAPPGWSWVGEGGPELMRLRGGEQILPHDVSEAAFWGYEQGGNVIEVAGGAADAGAKLEAHFHIEAGASPETVDAWKDYANSGAFREDVLEIVASAQADARRRAMI